MKFLLFHLKNRCGFHIIGFILFYQEKIFINRDFDIEYYEIIVYISGLNIEIIFIKFIYLSILILMQNLYTYSINDILVYHY